MRIAFVCACAEPGRDGVGDYSRLISEELDRLGHKTAVLALNDRALEGGSVFTGNTLRLPVGMPWNARLREAKAFLAEFRCDVLSLQFVGYGFDPRGLPLGLAAKLRTLAGGVPWHVMFHELWIEPEGGWASRVLSRLQKAHVVDLCKTLRPVRVHTSNDSYISRLGAAGITAERLPIFPNIPLAPPDPSLRGKLLEKIQSPSEAGAYWILVFFGTIHPRWDHGLFLKRVSSAAEALEKKILFVSVGKNPPAGIEIWNAMEKNAPACCEFLRLGEQDADSVSRLLQSADFAVATTPSSLLGKSGSFAAMASHGLPVIAPRFDGLPGLGPSVDAGIIPLDSGFAKALEKPMRPTNYPGPDEVARSLCQQLQSALP